MNDKFTYKRSFLIFNVEDSGLGTGQEPSGYVRIEVKEGKGKIQVLAQNLKEEKNRLSYSAYIISFDEKNICPVRIGELPVIKGKGELLWDFDARNVENTGKSIDEFNIASLLAEYEGSSEGKIICPLAAYKDNKKLKWREKLEEAIYKRKDKGEESKSNEKEEVKSKFEGQIESKYILPQYLTDNSAESDEKNGDILPDDLTGQDNMHGLEEFQKDADTDDSNTIFGSNQISGTEMEDDKGKKEFEFVDYQKLTDCLGAEGLGYGAAKPQQNCTYSQNGSCPAQTANNTFTSCMYCNMLKDKKAEGAVEKRGTGDIELLKKYLDKYFERCDPFKSRRRDYRWWKISSPVYLNNILYQCNIRTPILFNPRVISAHFKYRHIITGIYTDRVKRKELLVCGIPGVYDIDEKPFGDMCKWVQLEGYRPKYGAFGYWIAYLDPMTGKLLNIN